MHVGASGWVKSVFFYMNGHEKSSVLFEWQPVLLALISVKLALAANDPAR